MSADTQTYPIPWGSWKDSSKYTFVTHADGWDIIYLNGHSRAYFWAILETLAKLSD